MTKMLPGIVREAVPLDTAQEVYCREMLRAELAHRSLMEAIDRDLAEGKGLNTRLLDGVLQWAKRRIKVAGAEAPLGGWVVTGEDEGDREAEAEAEGVWRASGGWVLTRMRVR